MTSLTSSVLKIVETTIRECHDLCAFYIEGWEWYQRSFVLDMLDDFVGLLDISNCGMLDVSADS